MNLNLIMLHTAHVHEDFDLLSILLDTLIHGAKMLPLLFLAYLIIETVEHKAMDKLRRVFADKKTGVVGGALLGLIPECGFSVAAANLYSEKIISTGALAAVFIATSDEAFPILLSSGETRGYFLPLILVKLFLAVIAGFLLDFLYALFKPKHKHHRGHHHDHAHHHGEHIHEAGEHHHCAFCDSNKGIFLSALKRTVYILLFLIATVFVFNTVIGLIGEERVEAVMASIPFLQPFIAALIGLIPSCAVSIMLTGLFTEGIISFGALVAGLCAGAGAGIAVLLKSGRGLKKSLFLIGYLWLFSSLAGLIISIFA